MLFDFLILRVIFIGMLCRFRFFCIVIPDLIRNDKKNCLATCIIPYGGINNLSSKIMDSVFINLSNYIIVSCRV